ncbi:MAG: hypothetical protein Q8P67_19755 [archaeon]|nr:hypothetical protein [archaeon]
MSFYGGRGLVAAGVSLAVLSSPDLLFFRVASRDPSLSRTIMARTDSLLAASRLILTPTLASSVDRWGPAPALACSCIAQASCRLLLASCPKSLTCYVVYRLVNALSFVPLLAASASLLLRRHPDRGPSFSAANRRLLVFLALVRVAASRLAASPHRSPEQLMMAASSCSLLAACCFLLSLVFSSSPNSISTSSPLTSSNLTLAGLKQTMGEGWAEWKSSAGLFTGTPMKRALAGLVICASLTPALMGSPLQDHYRHTLKWGAAERARLNAVSDLALCLLPLLLQEVLPACRQGPSAMMWQLRLQALSFLNAATASPNTSASLLLNPLLEHAFSGQPFLDSTVAAALQGGHGAGRVEGALMLLQFPFSFIIPLISAAVAETSTRVSLVLIAGLLLSGSELILPALLHHTQSSANTSSYQPHI